MTCRRQAGEGDEPDVRLAPIACASRAAYRREVIFSCYKWDPQVGDVNTIGEVAAVLSAAAARELAGLAERLAAETTAMEQALRRRPALSKALGLPRSVYRALFPRGAAPEARARGVRVMRFDFHPTEEGWRISEVNSDVPGGFAEASHLARLAARCVAGTRAEGDPARAVAQAFAARLGGRAGRRVALVYATSYADDRQVMRCLADRLEAEGLETVLAAPDHLRWGARGEATCMAEGQSGPVHGVIRFFPAEWMSLLPRGCSWRGYYGEGMPACNHPQAMLTQTKRLPLVWDRLPVESDTWRALLPETRAPGLAGLRDPDGWVFKPALGRVGEGITVPGAMARGERRSAIADALLHRRDWVMQRRFHSRALPTAAGPRHLCIGVFVVEGRFAGFYGRLSACPRIDQYASDVPVVRAG